MDIELLGRQFAFHEAVALYRMVVQGTDTITEIRELIQVPERVEKALRRGIYGFFVAPHLFHPHPSDAFS